MEQQGTAIATAENRVEPTRKIRAELNLEQWSIWLPAKSKSEPKPRILTKEITLENGDKITARVEISLTARGNLTTEDQRTYYALIKYHEEYARPDDTTYFSLRKLSKILGKGWGSRASETITDSLARLYGTSFLWTHSYFDATTGEASESLEGFRILEKLKVIKTKRDGHTTRAEGYFKFNDEIIANLKKHHTKPVLLDVVLSFKSEVAQILYTQLDRILSRDITNYEKRTKELFEDLGLDGKAYVYASKRKQILVPAIAELENAPLSNGFAIASVKLEKTADGKDFKLIVRRGRTSRQNATAEPPSGKGRINPRSEEKRPSERRIEAKKEPTETERQGSELIAYFQQIFFNAEKQTIKPTQKHRELAAAIVAKHGAAVSRYIVEFAKAEAEKTNFQIATFGAIANYVDRAVASYTLHQAEIKRREAQEREDAKRRAVEQDYQKRVALGYELYNALPDAKRVELTDQYEHLLITSKEWKDKDLTLPTFRAIFESAVKSAIREQLIEAFETENGTAREA